MPCSCRPPDDRKAFVASISRIPNRYEADVPAQFPEQEFVTLDDDDGVTADKICNFAERFCKHAPRLSLQVRFGRSRDIIETEIAERTDRHGIAANIDRKRGAIPIRRRYLNQRLILCALGNVVSPGRKFAQ